MISVPNRHPPSGNRIRLLHLSPEERRDDFAWKIRRTDVYSSVLVDLATEELAKVRPLLPNDLTPFDELRGADQQRPPFSTFIENEVGNPPKK
jgi:hypothetical protein